MSFSGTVQSDFLKLIPEELSDKEKFINFAASDFQSLRSNLINYVKANFPQDYDNFEESDFGMLLIELMAAIGHIQSHKSDYLANESFIRTARERSSVKKLLELVGVRMKGPIAAVANASLSFTPTGDASSLTLTPNQRVVTITSPEDGAPITYTLYRVNTNGSIDLESNTSDLVFEFEVTGTPVITSAILIEGALVRESGTFASPDIVKSVNLSQFPYIEKSAQIFIDGTENTNGVYKEEDNIYFASGASDKVFQVVTDDSFRASILFGDDTVGRAPAVGDVYNITYRVGGGSRGNISNGFINAPVNGTAGLDGGGTEPTTVTVENISIATGGADAESVAKAKRYAPLKFRSQDRLVTLADYKAFANTFASNYGSTGKATVSARKAYSSANNLDIFVLEKASDTRLRQATQEYKLQLLQAIDDKKMITDDPIIVDGLIRTLDLNVTIVLDRKFNKQKPTIIARARDLVTSFFNVDNLEFGEPFEPQQVVKAILEEPQIRFASVDNVPNRIDLGFNEVIQLNNLSIRAEIL
jgi:hypothetical protein